MWKLLLGICSLWMSIAVTPKKIVKYLESVGRGDRDNLEFVSPETVRAGCIQLTRREYPNLKDYLFELLTLTKAAVRDGAQLVVFPEYIGLAPLSFAPFHRYLLRRAILQGGLEEPDKLRFDRDKVGRLARALGNFLYETHCETFSALARLQKVYIVAGTALVNERDGLRNRCVVFGPDGEPVGAQDKTSAIGPDLELGVEPSDEIEVIDTPMGKLAVVIGSDAYYFENFRIARAMGAQLAAVPDSKAGILCNLLRCRADEQELYVLYSCYAGLSETTRAGIFCPLGTDKSGIVAIAPTTGNEAVCARTSLQKLGGTVDLDGREPNDAFLQGDYLHSYCYCGALPMVGEAGETGGEREK